MTKTKGVGSLCEGLPPYVYDPPIEAVVFGWGVSEDGQLGLDVDGNFLSPKVVEALLGARLRGRDFGRSPIVAGSRNTLAITAEGDVYSWGWNARATLGHGHREAVQKPRRIAGLRGVGVVQVVLGGWHAMALDSQGQVWAWGGNEYSQCAVDPSLRDVTVPTRCLTDLRVCQIAAGGMHSLALTESGQLWMWGEPWGDFGMTIDRSPRRIDSTSDFVRVAAGAFHNLAVNTKGEVFTWGINDFGQLGNGTTSYATSPQHVVEDLEGMVIADVAAGGWHSLALTAAGEVLVWGRGEYGRLGLGDKTGSSKLRPTKVTGLEGYRVVEASCGGTHTMVVTDDGRAFIWGRGAFGRLGTGNERDFYSPVEVKLPGGPERWRILSGAVGGRHSFVLALPDNGDLDSRATAKWNSSRRSPREQGASQGLPVAVLPGSNIVETRNGLGMAGGGAGSSIVKARREGGGADADDEGEDDGYGGSEDLDGTSDGGECGGDGDKEETKKGATLIEAVAALALGNESFKDNKDGDEADDGRQGDEGEEEEEEEDGSDDGKDEHMAAEGLSPRPGIGGLSSESMLDDSESSDAVELGGSYVKRVGSLAAATLHGLRDDLPGDKA